jgi:hypothetical protein
METVATVINIESNNIRVSQGSTAVSSVRQSDTSSTRQACRRHKSSTVNCCDPASLLQDERTCTGFIWLTTGTSELWDSIKCWEFHEWLRNHQLLKDIHVWTWREHTGHTVFCPLCYVICIKNRHSLLYEDLHYETSFRQTLQRMPQVFVIRTLSLCVCIYVCMHAYSCCAHLEHRASAKCFVSLQFLNLRQSVGLFGRGSDRRNAVTYTGQHKHRISACIHALTGIRTHNPSGRTSEDS